MADDPVQNAIEGFRARLQAELDSQVRALADHHQETIDRVRATTEAEAERVWAAKIEEARGEWETRLVQQVGEAREEAVRAGAEELSRLRAELQQSAEHAERVRREMDDAVANAHRQALESIEAERVKGALAVSQALAQAAGQAEAREERRRQLEQTLETERARAERAVQDAQSAAQDRQTIESTRAEEHTWFESERSRLDGVVATLRADLDALRLAHDQELARARAGFETEMLRLEHELAEAHRSVEAEKHGADEALAQVRAAVDAEKRHAERAIAETRAEVDAEKRAAEQSLAAARAEADARKREAEQALAEARAAVDQEARRAEQSTAQALDASDARRLAAELALAGVRREVDTQARELEHLRVSLAAERRRAADVLPAPDLGALVHALRSVGAASSLSEMLGAAARGAGATAPRAALFVVSGDQLDEWAVEGMPSLSPGSISVGSGDAGLLADVVRTGEPVSSAGNGSAARVPGFASLPSGRIALGVPLVLDGHTVAVLYADDGREGVGRPGWQDSLTALGSHTAACAAALTALRTAQAMELFRSRGGHVSDAQSSSADSGARRYARLLLSEIKFYNEAAVRAGQQQRDLAARLRPEIDRARQLYDERISPSVGDRDTVFQEELVQTLAGGDARLLG